MKTHVETQGDITLAWEAAIKRAWPFTSESDHQSFAEGYRAALAKGEGDFKPGLYQHYKGGVYVALMLVEHHETRAKMVVYVSTAHGTVNVREYNKMADPRVEGYQEVDAWTDMVRPEGSFRDEPALVPRFKYIGP